MNTLSGPRHLRLETRGSIGLVFLSRPPVNAVNREMFESIDEVFSAPHEHFDSVRAIGLLSDLPHFCGGHDQDEADLVGTPGYLKQAARHVASIRRCPLPVVAGVTGAAAGTGFILAAAADVLVASPDAAFWLPEVELGLLGGAGHAARVLPPALVRLLVLTGQRISGSELVELGGALGARDAAAVVQTVIDLCDRIASRDPQVVRAARSVLDSIVPDASEVHVGEMTVSEKLILET